MIRLLFILLLVQSASFACALCAIYSPETQVTLNVKSTDTKIESVDVKWILTKDFTEQLKQIYDTNLDNKIDKNELKFIQQAFDDYAKLKNYMTHISYDKIINKNVSNIFKIKDSKAYIENGILHFSYRVMLDYKIKDDYALYIKIDDDENYFVLLMNKDYITFKNKAKISRAVEKQSVVFYINKLLSKKEPKSEQKIEKPKDQVIGKQPQEEQTLLQLFVSEVKKYLLLAQKGDVLSLFLLLFVSFVYGVIHALGPGHGKALAFSYFSANKSSYYKAFIISLASAFIHIIGALILVVVSLFILKSVLNNFVNDSVILLTQISAVMIMFLAFYIFLQKLKKKQCACSICSSKKQGVSWSLEATNRLKPNASIKFIDENNKIKKDLYFVLTAGLIPCPGTVILFIYAFVLKTYFAVLLAAIFISLGMGVVIFTSSFMGVALQRVGEKSHTFTRILELGSPIVMFILGLLLLLNANYI